ncbi:MAG: hypothetical protein RR561_05780 [Peptostreptococcus sp.]|uniref:hypothetical protein n=1 Tax=Peptostreptococcus sp. TaxID=1262 RepID=UPI002FC7846A
MDNKNTIKPMVEASILTSIFVVLTLACTAIGLGFFGYYDFLVPVFFAIIYIRCGWKYSSLSVIISILITFFILGNPITPIMLIQGSIIGLFTGYILLNMDELGNEIIVVSILSLLMLFVFDYIMRTFTNVSLVSNFDEFSKEMYLFIDKVSKMLNSGESGKSSIQILDNYRQMLASDTIKQSFFFSFSLISFGSGVIIYFLTMIASKKIKLDFYGKKYKLKLIGSLKRNVRFIYSSRKLFIIMIVYILFAELLKVFKVSSGIEYVDGFIFSLEYLFAIFTFKDSMVIIENKMIAESASVKQAKRYRILIIILFFINIKIMYIAAVVSYLVNDWNGKYRALFSKALDKNLEKTNRI